MKEYKTDMRRALTSWGFLAGAIGMVATLSVGASGDIIPLFQYGIGKGLNYGFHNQLILTAMHSDVVLLFVPILCALPYTAAFVEDYKSGYIKFYLPRSGIASYIKGKVAAAAVSGGLVLVTGIMAACVISALIFMPMEIAAVENMSLRSEYIRIMGSACLFFLFGCLWSLIGALLASVAMSKYLAYASPFILYYVLVILNERYIKDIYVVNPQIWLTNSAIWPGGNWGVALFLSELTAIAALGFGISMERRIKDA